MKFKIAILFFTILILILYRNNIIFNNPSRIWLINFHEHIESQKEAEKLLKIMDKLRIKKTILLGSPNYTLYLKKDMGFEKYHENNLEIIAIANKYPKRFSAFVTLNPLDDDNLVKLKAYLSLGAKGVKLYYGHGGRHGKGPFHVMRLDDVRMYDVFRYCEEKKIPILFHVNMNKYYNEFLSLMDKFPHLLLIVPHFMLSMWNEKRLKRMQYLFQRYPNLYTDISFGRPKYLLAGFRRMSSNIKLYRDFIIKHRKRFLFGTDIVITRAKFEQGFPVSAVIKAYRDFLEKEEFSLPFTEREKFNGLKLDYVTLKYIYIINPNKILNMKK